MQGPDKPGFVSITDKIITLSYFLLYRRHKMPTTVAGENNRFSNNTPISGATVSVEGTDVTALTDAEGQLCYPGKTRTNSFISLM